jgi:PIN domain nuclease of toxin-antitoxin system
MYVTDTHAFIWYTQSKSSKLGKSTRSLFNDAEHGRTLIHIPSIVLWEVADRLQDGTIPMNQRFDHWCRALDSKKGFQIQPLLWEDAHEARNLPFEDPFDCLITGTAMRLGVPVITKDTAITESRLIETIW